MINDDKPMKPRVFGFDKPTTKIINEKCQRVEHYKASLAFTCKVVS